MSQKNEKRRLSASFVIGSIAIVFLAIGYQIALFIHRAAALKIISEEMAPDTVFVVADGQGAVGRSDGSQGGARGGSQGGARVSQNGSRGPHGGTRDSKGGSCGASGKSDGYGGQGGKSGGVRSGRSNSNRQNGSGPGSSVVRHEGKYVREARTVKETLVRRPCETFRFNPNTVSVEDLCRLGFTLKQAESIDNYRQKGGQFRRKSDFAKSFVVADSVYRRLENYIDIPLLDINRADSAAFDGLPGIGGYFAAKMVEYRTRLGGYSYKEQLMDIYHLDAEKYDKFSDLICVGKPATPFRLWSLPPDSLRLHPYVKNWQTAKSIDFYRKNNPRTAWTVKGLADAGILDNETAGKLEKCRIAPPPTD